MLSSLSLLQLEGTESQARFKSIFFGAARCLTVIRVRQTWAPFTARAFSAQPSETETRDVLAILAASRLARGT